MSAKRGSRAPLLERQAAWKTGSDVVRHGPDLKQIPSRFEIGE